MNSWQLGLSSSDADLSPDDRLIAVTLESTSNPEKSANRTTVESLELWDYRKHSEMAATRLAEYASRSHANPVRFTADGSFLIAADPKRVHVLEANTLKPVRMIDPPLPQDFYISAAETSPVGHLAVIAADSGFIYGLLFAYDLDTGRLLFQWKPPGAVHSIAWEADGTQFAVATPFPCSSIGENVHVFGTNSWAHIQTLTAKNPESLAFSNNRLYSVQMSGCKGSVLNHHLGMEVFDVRAGRRIRTIFLPHSDIHDSVSFANGRLIADTGVVTTKYDWSDFVSYAREASVQFTIWKADNLSEVLFSPTFNSPQLPSPVTMRLSRTGRMVLLNPHRPEVFDVP